MDLREYWNLSSVNDALEEHIRCVLQAETAERGYMTHYDIAQALHIPMDDALDEVLSSLVKDGRITENPRGSGWFRIKRNKPREKLSSFTAIFFCSVCGTELYRHPHIKMKTQKKRHELQKASRLALFQHAMRVGHDKSSVQECWVNERWGDKGFEIPGEEPRVNDHGSASQVARVLGILPPDRGIV